MLTYSTTIFGNCVRLASRGVYGNALGEGNVGSAKKFGVHLWGGVLRKAIEPGRAILAKCGCSSPAADNPTLTPMLQRALQEMVIARGTELKN